ncbi:hypothetical protein WA841_01795 [Pseudomonas aeruginosa]
MPLYSAVDEGYEVEVYRTLKAACEAHADARLFVVPEDEFDDEASEFPLRLRQSGRPCAPRAKCAFPTMVGVTGNTRSRGTTEAEEPT